MHFILHMLAQMDHSRLQDSGTPELSVDSSTVGAWMIAAVLTIGILLITFKTSKRNFLEKE